MTSTLHPSIFSLPHIPLPSNSHPTSTLAEQAETETLIESLLGTTAPLDGTQPTILRRGEHNAYIGSTLLKLPGAYAALDASKPWLIFWTVQSLDILAIALDAEIKRR
jgi:protein farnesyltransferase subunit beta